MSKQLRPDVRDYAVAGAALFLGTTLTCLLVLFQMVRTGQIPRLITVVTVTLVSTALTLSLVEAVIPH